ncbi:hypothetical protein RJ640_027690 [Escallonia rubra]|uniref:CCHC-type domain-containing protein n=1 Tax=Escallonia rubra TaxID=112253 RepID=A0AA88UWF7_9ASTE|nr:hypothetical protein RJ640_027690 [Escallonia rubra]
MGQDRNRNVEIKQVGDNLFLIQFQNHGDKTRVLEGCPWAFEKSLIIIKEYEGDIQPSKIDLHWCPFWIHVINLPFNRMDRDTGELISKKVGRFLRVDLNEYETGWGKSLRIRTLIDTRKPLMRGVLVNGNGTDQLLVGIKYERLPNFCFHCGCLGHTENDCDARYHQNQERQKKFSYEVWLKAEPERKPFLKRSESSEAHDRTIAAGDKTGTGKWTTADQRMDKNGKENHGVIQGANQELSVRNAMEIAEVSEISKGDQQSDSWDLPMCNATNFAEASEISKIDQPSDSRALSISDSAPYVLAVEKGGPKIVTFDTQLQDNPEPLIMSQPSLATKSTVYTPTQKPQDSSKLGPSNSTPSTGHNPNYEHPNKLQTPSPQAKPMSPPKISTKLISPNPELLSIQQNEDHTPFYPTFMDQSETQNPNLPHLNPTSTDTPTPVPNPIPASKNTPSKPSTILSQAAQKSHGKWKKLARQPTQLVTKQEQPIQTNKRKEAMDLSETMEAENPAKRREINRED